MNTSHRRVNEDIKALLTGTSRETAFEGTVKEGFERRFTVINERDYKMHVMPSLKEKFEETLGEVLERIEIGRESEGKKPYNNYVVINLDEPYIGEVIEIMKRNGHWN
jgi:hypothetical protein